MSVNHPVSRANLTQLVLSKDVHFLTTLSKKISNKPQNIEALIQQFDQIVERSVASRKARAARAGGIELNPDLPVSAYGDKLIQLIRNNQVVIVAGRYNKDKNEWPDVSDTALSANINDWLMPFLNQARHVRDLAKVNVTDALLSLLSREQQQTLNRLLPTHIQVPSGSNIAIDYSTDIPILAVKLQEMFGYEGQPTVLNGQIALMIHLLSPARRPLQVTQDLPHFWRNSYADVRKDMRGRYPRHPWPEDPLSAEATRYTKARSKS